MCDWYNRYVAEDGRHVVVESLVSLRFLFLVVLDDFMWDVFGDLLSRLPCVTSFGETEPSALEPECIRCVCFVLDDVGDAVVWVVSLYLLCDLFSHVQLGAGESTNALLVYIYRFDGVEPGRFNCVNEGGGLVDDDAWSSPFIV